MNISKVISTIKNVLSPHVKQNIEVLSLENKAVFWFDGNRFPLDIINTGAPCVDELQGYTDVLYVFNELKKQNVDFKILARKVGDETGFEKGMTQDFKLIATISN